MGVSSGPVGDGRSTVGCRTAAIAVQVDPLAHSLSQPGDASSKLFRLRRLPEPPRPRGPSNATVQPCRSVRLRLTVPERARWQAAGGHTVNVPVNDPRATGETTGALSVRPLDVLTWPAFARLVEAKRLLCMGFHVKVGKGRIPAQNRAEKEQRVREGRTHAALVLDGDQWLGWCQFRSPGQLPEIKSRRRYEKGLTALPAWRITCFFTARACARCGVADAAARRGVGRDRWPRRRHGRGLPGGDRRSHAVEVVPAHRSDGRL